jgi:hypothetical protein
MDRIAGSILRLRGQQVMLSHDLALMDGVETKALMQAVKRNTERFPDDFVFQPARQEIISLKSQIATSGRGGAQRGLPDAFTEQGVAMLSGVLRGPRARCPGTEMRRTAQGRL